MPRRGLRAAATRGAAWNRLDLAPARPRATSAPSCGAAGRARGARSGPGPRSPSRGRRAPRRSPGRPHAEGQQHAHEAAAGGARERDRVGDLAEEVGEHDQANDGAVPKAFSIPYSTAMSKPHQANAPSSRGSAERTCPIASRTAPPSTAPAVRRRPVPSVGIHAAAASDSAIPSAATPAGSAVRASGPSPLSVSSVAGDGDRAEEDGVDEHEEGQQRARGPAGAEPGAAQRPQRHRRAAGAGGRRAAAWRRRRRA